MESPAEANPAERFPPKETFEALVLEIHKEIQEIQNGSSDLTPYPIQFPKDRVLPAIILDRFIQKPMRKSLIDFLIISRQDLGAKAYNHWREQFNTILEGEDCAPIH